MAIALGPKGFSIRNCMGQFKSLVRESHSVRELNGVPILHQLVVMHHGSKYKTTPMRLALHDFLGDAPFFGYTRYTLTPKIAVISTNEAGNKPIIIASYNRSDNATNSDKRAAYEFSRAPDPSMDFNLWEAAAATMSTPYLFKAFQHPSTQLNYVDGMHHKSNPVMNAQNESRVLWPDTAELPPDILLSLGSGQNRNKKDQRKDILDAEQEWRGFVNSIPDGVKRDGCRFVRINPDLGEELPHIDAVAECHSLKNNISQQLMAIGLETGVRNVAWKLVATTFYFHMTSDMTVGSDGRCRVMGKISTFCGQIPTELTNCRQDSL